MRRFAIGNRVIEETSPDLQRLLGQARTQRLRAMCMCREPPVPMYIARVEDQHTIKRMPLSGRDHHPACPSYEPPYELSGLGPLIGTAIEIDASGRAELKLDFSLTKKGPRAAAGPPAPSSKAVIHRVPQKLSLKALLHYLWEAGELTEWRSTWKGKRGWGRVRASLLHAAARMITRRGLLSEILFVPEVFRVEDREGIATRRAAVFKRVEANGVVPRKLMLIVAEVKEFSPARDGQKVFVRHMPFPLMIEESTWQRFTTRHEAELQLWRSNESFHLIVIATFGVSAAGIAAIEDIAPMVVNEHWLPIEDVHEAKLLEKLCQLKRKSVKGQRFNLPRGVPIVCVTLPEQRPAPVAMFIVPASAGADYEQRLCELIEARPEITPWIWRVAEGELPPIP
ncbi:DUF1173 domain-containing protein [Brucella intermedia]|uniref:DUF1173 domain-containing protein n=1 Tax=Brucella TaxID=234 RepID=UPI00094621CF|nr:DUF1173 domain-containing protein [Brucella intermedia]